MSLFLNLSENQRAKPVYRIIRFERIFELFAERENVLIHPSRWEDPYENFILRSKVRGSDGTIRQYDYHKNFYGQCWTLNDASDAMWRIYSHNRDGVRIRTTVEKLAASLYHSGVHRPDMFCVIGKVEYLSEKKLRNFANGIYHKGQITKENLFRSLLVKRKAFQHEKEVRLLYFDETKQGDGDLLRYTLDPHELIDQIMVDPRVSYERFKEMKAKIATETCFSGKVLRSLLYRAPEEMILDDTAV